MNTQKRSKQDLSIDGMTKYLPVVEIFDTIQGEGPYSGMTCTFIRLGGCNLQCSWCDTEYSKFTLMSVAEIIIQANKKLVVITGGEPFLYNITPLTATLLERGHKVQVETNGTLSCRKFPWHAVTVVCSPKSGRLNEAIISNVSNFKYVVGHEDKKCIGGIPSANTQGSAGTPSVPPPRSTIYLMPRTDDTEEENIANKITAVHLVQKYDHILSLRLHKELGLQ